MAGVFEARTQRLQIENARLEMRRDSLQAEIDLAPLRALTERIRATQDVDVSAIEELIALLKGTSKQQEKNVSHLAMLTDAPEAPPVFRALIFYCVYHATNNPEWRRRVLQEIEHSSSRLDGETREHLLAILGAAKWDEEDRRAVSESLFVISGTSDQELRSLALFQIGRLHEGGWGYATGRDDVRFRWFDSDSDKFYTVVSKLRDAALNDSDTDPRRERAMRALANIAPPAFLATTALLLGENTVVAEQRASRFRFLLSLV